MFYLFSTYPGPHIGYSQEKGWGNILRPGQHKASSCCGALVGTLSNLEKGNIKPGIPDQDDYQGGGLNQFDLANSEKILSSANRLAKLTKFTNEEAEAKIKRMKIRKEDAFLPKLIQPGV